MNESFKHTILLLSKGNENFHSWTNDLKKRKALECWVLKEQEVVLVKEKNNQFRMYFKGREGAFCETTVTQRFLNQYNNQFTAKGTLLTDPDKEKRLREWIYGMIKIYRGEVRSLSDRAIIKLISTGNRSKWGLFVPQITISSKTSQKKYQYLTHPKLRVKTRPRDKYTWDKNGVRRIGSQAESDPLYSPAQSASIIAPWEGFRPPVFTDPAGEYDCKVGVRVEEADVELVRGMGLDGGTYFKPFHHKTKAEAKVDYEAHKEIQTLDGFIKKVSDWFYNEYMLRFKPWNRNGTAQICIFLDNQKSRLMAQVRAGDLERCLLAQQKENREAKLGRSLTDEAYKEHVREAQKKGEEVGYKVPISFYLSHEESPLKYYIPKDQRDDLYWRLHAGDPEARALALLVVGNDIDFEFDFTKDKTIFPFVLLKDIPWVELIKRVSKLTRETKFLFYQNCFIKNKKLILGSLVKNNQLYVLEDLFHCVPPKECEIWIGKKVIEPIGQAEKQDYLHAYFRYLMEYDEPEMTEQTFQTIFRKHKEGVEFDIDARDHRGETLLYKVLTKNKLEIAACLLKAGANIDHENNCSPGLDNDDCYKSLCECFVSAALCGDIETCRYILKLEKIKAKELAKRINASGWPNEFHCIRIWAAYYGYWDILKYLLEFGVDSVKLESWNDKGAYFYENLQDKLLSAANSSGYTLNFICHKPDKEDQEQQAKQSILMYKEAEKYFVRVKNREGLSKIYDPSKLLGSSVYNNYKFLEDEANNENDPKYQIRKKHFIRWITLRCEHTYSSEIDTVRTILTLPNIDKGRLFCASDSVGYLLFVVKMMNNDHLDMVKLYLENHTFPVDKRFIDCLANYLRKAVENNMAEDSKSIMRSVVTFNNEKASIIPCNIQSIIDLKDKQGMLLLHFLASRGHFKLVNILLEQGGSPKPNQRKSFEQCLNQGLRSRVGNRTQEKIQIRSLLPHLTDFSSTVIEKIIMYHVPSHLDNKQNPLDAAKVVLLYYLQAYLETSKSAEGRRYDNRATITQLKKSMMNASNIFDLFYRTADVYADIVSKHCMKSTKIRLTTSSAGTHLENALKEVLIIMKRTTSTPPSGQQRLTLYKSPLSNQLNISPEKIILEKLQAQYQGTGIADDDAWKNSMYGSFFTPGPRHSYFLDGKAEVAIEEAVSQPDYYFAARVA